MSNVFLVGTLHGMGGNAFLRPGAPTRTFAAEVLPRLAAEPVFVIEGGLSPTRISPGTSRHDKLLLEYATPLLGTAIRPTFLLVDPIGKPGAAQDVLQAMDRVFGWANAHVSLEGVPPTIEALIPALAADQVKFFADAKPDRRVRGFAGSILLSAQTRHTAFANALRRVEPDRQVVFLGGLSHAIALHREHKWPLVNLMTTEAVREARVRIEDVARGYLHTTAIAQAIVRDQWPVY